MDKRVVGELFEMVLSCASLRSKQTKTGKALTHIFSSFIKNTT